MAILLAPKFVDRLVQVAILNAVAGFVGRKQRCLAHHFADECRTSPVGLLDKARQIDLAQRQPFSDESRLRPRHARLHSPQ